jgi:hypothetical protein
VNEVQTVKSELVIFSELRRRLTELYADLDEQTLADTLEGATNLREALAALIRSALEDEALAKGLRSLLDRMKERLSRLEARADSKRLIVLDTMKAAALQKCVEPDFTASLRTVAPSLVILCETEIPTQFLTPQPPKIDRRSLLQALNDGASIPGVSLSADQLTLSVRTQ